MSAIDPSRLGSPGWYFQELLKKLNDKQSRLDTLSNYLEGNAPLPEGARGLKEAYRSFQRKARTNFAEIVVEAVQERMTPAGFTVTDGEDEIDKLADRIWSVNELGVFSGDVHGDMLGLSEGYVIVGAPDASGIPVVTREDPRQMAVMTDPLRPQRVIAALKTYSDEARQKNFAYLYLPGRVLIATAPYSVTSINSAYQWDESLWVNGGLLPTSTATRLSDDMPVVRFGNRRDKGEFETHTDILDRINFMVLQRLVITAMQAFRQRAIKDTQNMLPEAEMSVDGEGNEIEVPIDYGAIFRPGPGNLWILPEGVDLWESQPTDFQSVLLGTKDDVAHLAAVTRTPMFMLMPQGENQSAEGAAAAREGLVLKAAERIKRATYGWNQVMQLALKFAGAGVVNVETQWLPPNLLTLSERADAASKSTDIPWSTKMRTIWQYSPAEVERMEAERIGDIMNSTLGQEITGANAPA